VTVRELLAAVTDHAEDGRHMDDVVILRIGREDREVRASYTDGTFILIAGAPLRH
jgi:hypothetical protein